MVEKAVITHMRLVGALVGVGEVWVMDVCVYV